MEHGLKIFLKNTSTEWEGTAYVAVYGDRDAYQKCDLGQVYQPYRDSFIILKNLKTGTQCGGIIKSISSDNEDYVEIDSCLAVDLLVTTGDTLSVAPLKPVMAEQIHIAVSGSDLNQSELQNLCKTYFARQPLSAGQRKPIYLFTGEKNCH